MKLFGIRPMLYTAQLKDTVDFYVHQLGFACDEFREDWGWAVVHRDSAEIMFALPDEHIPFRNPHFTGSFYINSSNIDALWEELKEKARLCYPIEDFDYGMREFALYDNNGYLLQFGQPLEEVK